MHAEISINTIKENEIIVTRNGRILFKLTDAVIDKKLLDHIITNLTFEGKIKAKKIYEDNELVAALEINPASLGHAIVFPKKHFSVLAQLKDVGNLFNIINKISSVLFET